MYQPVCLISYNQVRLSRLNATVFLAPSRSCSRKFTIFWSSTFIVCASVQYKIHSDLTVAFISSLLHPVGSFCYSASLIHPLNAVLAINVELVWVDVSRVCLQCAAWRKSFLCRCCCFRPEKFNYWKQALLPWLITSQNIGHKLPFCDRSKE